MPRKSQASQELSPAARAALTRLGEDIGVAIKTREPYARFAERVGINRVTLRKLVNGDPGVSLGTFVAVLDALRLLDHIENVAMPENDPLGQSLRLGRAKPDVGLNMNTDF
jgi:hypothetical protein